MDTVAPTRPVAPSSRPVFIVGCPRSGTTLLQFRLRELHNLSIPTGESHVLVPFHQAAASYPHPLSAAERRDLVSWLWHRNPEFFETDLHGLGQGLEAMLQAVERTEPQTPRDLFATILRENAAGEGKTRWGDKTPYYVRHIDKILDWYPDAQIIHLIRDGRDVALSLLSRQHDFKVYNAFLAAETWQGYVEAGCRAGRALRADQYCEVRYEDLVAAPHDTLQRLCAFLGEPYTEDVLHTRLQGNGAQQDDPLVYQPIKADNAGKWRTTMRARDIDIFERVAGDTLSSLGYDLTRKPAAVRLTSKALYRLHNLVRTRLRKRRVRNWAQA